MTNGASDLYDLLEKAKSSTKNNHDKQFISKEAVMQDLFQDLLLKWIEDHPLSQLGEPTRSKAELVEAILDNSRLLFSMLVLAKAECLTSRLVLHGFNDDILFDSSLLQGYCEVAKLNEEEKSILFRERSCIGAIIRNDIDQEFSQEITLPYKKIYEPGEDGMGGFGIVRRAELAAGHLKSYSEVMNPSSNAMNLAHRL